MSEDLERLGLRIKTLREEKQLTQAELGAVFGYGDRNIQKMEYGRSNVYCMVLIGMADYFEVSLEYLTGRSDWRGEKSNLKVQADLQTFAQRLKALRNEKGITQKKMAEMLERTERHYQDIEAAKVNVSCRMLTKLADFFGVTTDYLVGRTEQSNLAIVSKHAIK